MATEPLTEFEAKYPDPKARQAAEAWFKLTGSSYSPPYGIGDSLTHQRLAFNNAPRTGKHRLVFTSLEMPTTEIFERLRANAM